MISSTRSYLRELKENKKQIFSSIWIDKTLPLKDRCSYPQRFRHSLPSSMALWMTAQFKHGYITKPRTILQTNEQLDISSWEWLSHSHTVIIQSLQAIKTKSCTFSNCQYLQSMVRCRYTQYTRTHAHTVAKNIHSFMEILIWNRKLCRLQNSKFSL